MFHIVLIAIVAGASLLCWALVNSAPPVLSFWLPRKLTFYVGAGLFVIALFAAFAAAYALGDPRGMVVSFIQGYVGLWLMFAGSAGLRGYPEYDQMTRRVGLMIAVLVATIVIALYVPDARLISLLSFGLVSGGLVLTAQARQSR